MILLYLLKIEELLQSNENDKNIKPMGNKRQKNLYGG
jgi:hypothetical protein